MPRRRGAALRAALVATALAAGCSQPAPVADDADAAPLSEASAVATPCAPDDAEPLAPGQLLPPRAASRHARVERNEPVPPPDDDAAAAALLADVAPTGPVVNERAAALIRRGYELAERGASFAARREFVAALQLLADAKDQRHGSPRRTVALAHGLRALDEAADFAPVKFGGGSQLKLSVIVAAHRTPAAQSLDVDRLLPQQVADVYFAYAERMLGASVAGEPAGSMALHALGKLASRMGRFEPAQCPLAERQALALQNAALLARSDNHLAAHELGVLLAENGHLLASEQVLRQVAAHAPHPTVYRNLARVERRLGRPDLAAGSENQAAVLAAQMGGDQPVQWVSADALARTPDAMGPSTNPPRPGAAGPMTARGPGGMIR